MKTLHVVVGPTASGKTAYAIRLALSMHTEVVSCDSRQFYHELSIGVARPTSAELKAVPHHFIACRSVLESYNVYDYEQDALQVLEHLFRNVDDVVAVGGSGLYVEALCNGISQMPTPSDSLRCQLKEQFRTEGILSMFEKLRQIDPVYAERVDASNPIRIQRALEVSLTVGRPYSEVLADSRPKERPFAVQYHGIDLPADELRRRINSRVDMMFSDGLETEARALEPLWHSKHPQPLNTVGYKEFYEPLPDNSNPSAPHTVADWIKLNTWHYARKQRTWFKKTICQ